MADKHPKQTDFYERLFEDDSYQVKPERQDKQNNRTTKPPPANKDKRYPVP